MVAAWILYSLVVTGGVAAAAWLLERALGEAGGATRWAWGLGMAAALVLSLLALWPGGPEPAGTSAGVEAHAAVVDPGGLPALFAGTIEVSPGGALSRLDLPLALLWAALVLWIAVRTAVGAGRLLAERRRWRRTALPEGDVLVSRGLGPAVVGLLHPQIVVPEWCLELSQQERALVLAHEEEHRRARDPLLVFLAGVVAGLLPWNLPLVWMRRRLRTAVEVDCDARVAGPRSPAHKRIYGELLLRVGHRTGRGPVPLATFAEQPSALSHRIRMLARPRSRWAGLRALALAAAGVLLVVGACLVPGPDRSDGITDPTEESLETPAGEARGTEGGPSFTPYEVAPEVRNRGEVGEALGAEYPELLRRAGIEGTVLLHFFILEDGELGDVRVAESSGHPALDEAALRVAHVFRFSPARNQGRAVPVWIQLPIVFQSASAEGSPAERVPLREPPPEGADRPGPEAERPYFTPYEVAPEILNRGEVGEALRREYPALLRDAGIGGTVVLHVFIGEDGAIEDARVAEPSGHDALDEAALRVARAFRFSPALNEGRAVPVWIQIPITFQAG